MKKQDKIFEVENLSAKIKDAKTVALIDYRGLKVNQINQLRSKVREAGGELQVAKNNLLLRALRKNSYKIERLEGPTLTLFANTDEIIPLKALAEFGKSLGLLPFKLGFFKKQVLSAEDLNRFAALPGRQELQAKLVGMLSGQPSRLVYALNWNLQKLVLAVSAVKAKKS